MKRILKWLITIMLGLLVLVAVLLVVLPAIYASSLAVVYSGSMEPVMPVGALAWMDPVDPSEIKVGDIIAFNPPWDPEVTVSHRVIEVLEEPTLSFRTKGDANEDPDFDIVPADNVLGCITFNAPNLGYILNEIGRYTKSQLGFSLFVAVPTLLLIGSAVRDMRLALNPRKRRKRQRQKILERRKWRKSHQ
jgi:signal peptidase